MMKFPSLMEIASPWEKDLVKLLKSLKYGGKPVAIFPDDEENELLVRASFEFVVSALKKAGWKIKMVSSFRGSSSADASKRGTNLQLNGGADMVNVEMNR